jgi:hypothetical protein
MRKLLIAVALLAAFAWSSTSYGVMPTRVLVYNGTIKASHSIFDVNDPAVLFSGSVKGYWAVRVIDSGSDEGYVIDSNAVLYDAKAKEYKVIPDSVSIDPCDPCGVVMFIFNPMDADGQMLFYAVGKGKLTKFSNDAAVAKDFVPTSLKGTGLIDRFDFFDPEETMSGSVMVSLTLDSARTRAANPYLYTVDDVINSVVTQLTSKGGWTNWPYNPAP